MASTTTKTSWAVSTPTGAARSLTRSTSSRRPTGPCTTNCRACSSAPNSAGGTSDTAVTRPSAAPTATPRSPPSGGAGPAGSATCATGAGCAGPRYAATRAARAPRQQQPGELTERRDVVEVRDEHAGELGHGAAGGPPEPCQQTLFSEYRRIIAVRHKRASEY
ncbi:hypothetical protein PG995_004648 [Apiospora arundinis]